MEKNIKKIGDCSYEIQLIPTSEEWVTYIEKASKKLETNVEIPGFRKGKAPQNLVKGKVSNADILDEALNTFLQKHFEEIVKEEKLLLAQQPNVHIEKVTMEELSVHIHVIVEPVIKVGNYKGHEVEKELIVVIDEELEEKIKEVQTKNVELVVKETGKVENQDVVIIDFEGFLNGVAFEGGKAEKFQLEIGSNSFVPGFEEQLIGMESGEGKDITITFPVNYTPELAGKEVVFKIVLHEIKSKVLPQIDDDLALDANLDDVSTLEELKEHFRKELFVTKQKEAANVALDKVLDLIIKDSHIEIADDFIQKESDNRIENIKLDLKNQKIEFKDYLAKNKLSEEEFVNKIKEQSKNNIVFAYVIIDIANKENISVSEEELDDTLKGIASMYNQSLEMIKDSLKDRISGFRQEMLFNKVYEFLKKENNLNK